MRIINKLVRHHTRLVQCPRDAAIKHLCWLSISLHAIMYQLLLQCPHATPYHSTSNKHAGNRASGKLHHASAPGTCVRKPGGIRR
eukprot:scaffold109033_cov17-Tisochrysis_lutea.AAC.1